MQIGPFGLPELLAILAIALIIFGPRRLPELSRSLGRALGEFRRGSMDLRRSLEDEVRSLDGEIREEKTPAPAPGPPPLEEKAVDPVEEAAPGAPDREGEGP